VNEGHWPSTTTKMESLIGTDAFSNFLMGGPYEGSATAAQSVEIYLESTMYEDYQEVTVDLQSCFDSKLQRYSSKAWSYVPCCPGECALA
jgi:hypothetical protein